MIIKNVRQLSILQSMQHESPELIPFHTFLKVIKQHTFHFFMKSAPISGSQSFFKILQLLVTRRYQSLVI